MTRAPGKLYILGEYAVVTPGEPAIVAAVNRYLSVQLQPAQQPGVIRERSRNGAAVPWQHHDGNANVEPTYTRTGALRRDYLRRALDVGQRYALSLGHCLEYTDVQVENDLVEPNGRKLGLGSSAAIVVAALRGVCAHYNIQVSGTDVYKLAMIASVQVSPMSSGGDIAAAVFGGWVEYCSPDRNWLGEQLASGVELPDLLGQSWPGLQITRINPPTGYQLCVGWTQSPASSPELVSAIHVPHRQKLDRTSEAYREFLSTSRRLVRDFTSGAITAIQEARELMRQLGNTRGRVIETPALASLCDIGQTHGGVAKVSGAGGGDCGIVFLPSGVDPNASGGLYENWRSVGIEPLMLHVSNPLAEPEGYSEYPLSEGNSDEHITAER